MGPSVDLNTEAVLVEFDFLQTLLKDRSVKLRVEAVARDAQRIHVSGHESLVVVLLLSEVLYRC